VFTDSPAELSDLLALEHVAEQLQDRAGAAGSALSVAISQALIRLGRLNESALAAQEAQRLGEALQAAHAVARTVGRSSEVRQI